MLTKEERDRWRKAIIAMEEKYRAANAITEEECAEFAFSRCLLKHADEADRVISRLREALEPFLDHDCENPARCRMMRQLNQGAVLCRICEAQAALAAGKES